MKKKIGKILSIFLILMLLVSISSLFVACNKDGEDVDTEAIEREALVSTLENTILSGMDSEWSPSLTDDDIALKDDAGDFVVSSNWTKFVCEVVKSSYLQNAKIKKLNDILDSDDGKKILSDIANNVELIIPALRETGFTSNDVAYLIYDVVYSLVDNGKNVLTNIKTQLENLTKTSSNEENINDNYAAIDTTLSSMPNEEKEVKILAAIEDAKTSIINISSFAYNMSINTITEDLYELITSEEGALSDVTETEIQTFVNSLINNIKELKTSLTQEELNKLDTALSLVINTFDTNDVKSNIFLQIVEYGKSAYTFIDFAPTLCDVVISASNLIGTTDFITDYKTIAKMDNATDYDKQINYSIIISQLINKVLADYTKEDLKSAISDVALDSTDAQKSSVLYTVDLLLNFSSKAFISNGEYAHKTVMTNDNGSMLIILSAFGENYTKFKNAYYKYKIGEATLTELINAKNSCGFDNFDGVDNPYEANNEEEFENWYQYYITTGLEVVNKANSDLVKVVKSDMEMFVDDYYKENSEIKLALDTLASYDLKNGITESEYNANYKNIIVNTGLAIIVGMLTK